MNGNWLLAAISSTNNNNIQVIELGEEIVVQVLSCVIRQSETADRQQSSRSGKTLAWMLRRLSRGWKQLVETHIALELRFSNLNALYQNLDLSSADSHFIHPSTVAIRRPEFSNSTPRRISMVIRFVARDVVAGGLEDAPKSLLHDQTINLICFKYHTASDSFVFVPYKKNESNSTHFTFDNYKSSSCNSEENATAISELQATPAWISIQCDIQGGSHQTLFSDQLHPFVDGSVFSKEEDVAIAFKKHKRIDTNLIECVTVKAHKVYQTLFK